MKLADRIARLESRYRPAAPDPFTDGVLDRLTEHCHLGEMVRAENREIIKPRHKT